MILIKLKDVLNNYDLSIADLSDGTGIARSTLTPLVNSPDDVKGLKLETIDSICDFLGITIQDLLEFKPESKKYKLNTYWYDEGQKQVFVLMSKKVGTKERFSLLKVDIGGFSFSDSINDDNTLVLNTRISFLNKDEVQDVSVNFNNFPTLTSFPKGNIFKDDLIKQTDENIKNTSRIIAKLIKLDLLKSLNVPKNLEVSYININWEFNLKTINKISYLFDIRNENIEYVENYDVENSFLSLLNIEDM